MRNTITRLSVSLALAIATSNLFSAEAAAAKKALPDQQPNPKKLNPPPGVVVPADVRQELTRGAAALGSEIANLRLALSWRPALLELLPDVQIYHNAVRYALEDDIFYSPKQFETARSLLNQGIMRARQLRNGQTPWTTATGLVVRGYVSRLDGSVQPYGLVVPASYKPSDAPHRLDFWLHGRGDTLSELSFIEGRQRSMGEFTPEEAFVLHPYGRFMNAFKFAGEVDVFEALAHAAKHYRIDLNRVAMRGFSMGGAGAWQLGAHHAGLWASVNPGAGFVDVKNYQGLSDRLNTIPWYEQKLWHFYDPLDYVIDFVNTTLVAYSGEIDAQKKAADLMEKALAAEGIKMTHIIGPNTGHKYEPEAKKVVAGLVDDATNKGRNPAPAKVTLLTWSLKWNQMHWLTLDSMEREWELARIDAELAGDQFNFQTTNATAFTIRLSKDLLAHARQLNGKAIIGAFVIDSSVVSIPDRWLEEYPPEVHFSKRSGKWEMVAKVPGGFAKRHDLQGPIDDAFMDSFIIVRPTGRPMNEAVGNWAKAEMSEAIFSWRRQFRGEAQVKDDSQITSADIENNNLILWGDPRSNKLLERIAGKLPIRWNSKWVQVAGKKYPADKNIPALIFPNPLNPKRYVVVNSGFTFAAYGASSNSQQTPKLPDWAILDLNVPSSARLLGVGVADAGFFNERWQLEPSAK